MIQNFLDNFSLSVEPFTLTPNLDLMYKNPQHQQIFQRLLYQLQTGNSLLVISGEVGTGKTLLCRKLLYALEENHSTAYIPNPGAVSKNISAAIASDLGLSGHKISDEFSIFDSINRKLVENINENKPTVLVIDEAQLLNDEAIESVRMLTNLETSDQKLIQIVMFAQPELLEKLEQPSLRQFSQRVTEFLSLDRLPTERVAEYIRKRLILSGHDNGDIFKGEAIKLITQYSQGVPRIINVLAEKSMQNCFARQDDTVDKQDVKGAIQMCVRQLETVSQRHTQKKKSPGRFFSITMIIILLTMLGGLCYLDFYSLFT